MEQDWPKALEPVNFSASRTNPLHMPRHEPYVSAAVSITMFRLGEKSLRFMRCELSVSCPREGFFGGGGAWPKLDHADSRV